METGISMMVSSAERIWSEMSVSSSNIINVSVPGYRADASYVNQLKEAEEGAAGDELPPEFELKAGSRFSEGEMRITGRDLDVAIQGDGWFVVEDQDGNEGLSRNGSLVVDREGVLRNSVGFPISGDGGQINFPAHSGVSIGENGVITVTSLESGDREQIGRIRLVKTDNKALQRQSNGLFTTDEGYEIDDTITLLSGRLEESNVSAVDEYVGMLGKSRLLDVHIRTLKGFNHIADRGNEVFQSRPG